MNDYLKEGFIDQVKNLGKNDGYTKEEIDDLLEEIGTGGGSEVWVDLVNETVEIEEAVSIIQFNLGTTKEIKKFWVELFATQNTSETPITGYWWWGINGQSFGAYWQNTNISNGNGNSYFIKGEYMGDLLFTNLGTCVGADKGMTISRVAMASQTRPYGQNCNGIFEVTFANGTYKGNVRCLIKAVFK